jgi:dTDP-glucose 4,6-dehydratase
MKLLVTGGSGFIGSHFILRWLRLHPGDSIINVTRRIRECDLVPALQDARRLHRYHCVEADIADINESWPGVCEAEQIVHCAAESSVETSLKDPAAVARVNVLGTLALLEFARRRGTRIHLVSTFEVFGQGDCDLVSEGCAFRPENPYGACAAGIALLALSFQKAFDLPLTLTYGTNTFGPGQRLNKLIPRFVTRAIAEQDLPVYGHGNHVRNWVYVEDHCSAIECALERGTPGHSYCVSGETRLSSLDIAERILRQLGKPSSQIRFVTDRASHCSYPAADTSSIRSLGWKPAYEFDRALEETIQWYVDHSARRASSEVKRELETSALTV